MKMKTLAVTGLVLVLGLAACGQEETDSTEETAGSRTFTDGMGIEVEVPSDPQNILASYLEDYLVVLDVTPVAQWSVNDGASVQDYLQEDLEGLPTVPYDLPFEVVAEYDPDLMLIRDPIDEGMHEQYSQITPTYVLNSSPTDWNETLLEIGEVLGKENEAQTVLNDYEEKAESAAVQLSDVAAGESAAAIWLVDTNFFIVNESRSSGAVLYGDLGLEVPDLVSRLSGDADWAATSLEELAQLDADHLFLINSDGADSEILQDRLWQNIPAVQEGNIYEFGPETAWLYYGPVASGQILDHVVESIVE